MKPFSPNHKSLRLSHYAGDTNYPERKAPALRDVMPLVPSLSERLGSSRNVGLVWRFVNECVSSMTINHSDR